MNVMSSRGKGGRGCCHVSLLDNCREEHARLRFVDIPTKVVVTNGMLSTTRMDDGLHIFCPLSDPSDVRGGRDHPI